MIERRKHRRFKAQLLITTLYRDELGRIVSFDSILSEDISAGGLRLVFPKRLPRGRVLDLQVFLFSDPIHLPAQGRVVWSNEKQELEVAVKERGVSRGEEIFWVGIEFIDIDALTRRRIIRWIKTEFNVPEV